MEALRGGEAQAVRRVALDSNADSLRLPAASTVAPVFHPSALASVTSPGPGGPKRCTLLPHPALLP